jgi:hypothetical protein
MNLSEFIPKLKEIHCAHQTRRGSCKYNNQNTPINSRVAHLFIILQFCFLFCYVLCLVFNVAYRLSAFSILYCPLFVFFNFYLQNNPHFSWRYNILLLMIKYLHVFVNWHKINTDPVPDIYDMPIWYEANTRFNCIELLLN